MQRCLKTQQLLVTQPSVITSRLTNTTSPAFVNNALDASTTAIYNVGRCFYALGATTTGRSKRCVGKTALGANTCQRQHCGPTQRFCCKHDWQNTATGTLQRNKYTTGYNVAVGMRHLIDHGLQIMNSGSQKRGNDYMTESGDLVAWGNFYDNGTQGRHMDNEALSASLNTAVGTQKGTEVKHWVLLISYCR